MIFEMIKDIILALFLRLIKGYSIFFIDGDTAYFVNDVLIDSEMKEIILSSVNRSGEKND